MTFEAWSAYGIFVSNKDILEVCPIDGAKSLSDGHASSTVDAPLPEAVCAWLFKQVQMAGFQCFDVADAFTLVTVDKESTLLPTLDIYCHCLDYVEEWPMAIDVKPSSGESKERLAIDDSLVSLALKLTPTGRKLPFRPGQCFLSSSQGCVLRKICKSELEKKAPKPYDVEETIVGSLATFVEFHDRDDDGDNAPQDMTLVIGTGETAERFLISKALLCCCVPGFEAFVSDNADETEVATLEFPTLEPAAVKAVLVHHTTRNKSYRTQCQYGSFPDERGLTGNRRFTKEEKGAIEAVQAHFQGLHGQQDTVPVKKPRIEEIVGAADHPALNNPRWLDATFLVGPNQARILANRAALAFLNPVLHKVLYGTHYIKTDPSLPIIWAEHDETAVRLVFQALVGRGENEVVIPPALADAGKRFVDFIGETEEALNIYFDTMFCRENLGGAYFNAKTSQRESARPHIPGASCSGGEQYLEVAEIDYMYKSKEPLSRMHY